MLTMMREVLVWELAHEFIKGGANGVSQSGLAFKHATLFSCSVA
jgi:hypothetical protein